MKDSWRSADRREGTMQLQDGVDISARNQKETTDDCPTIFHITHWKAGSQWIHRILSECKLRAKTVFEKRLARIIQWCQGRHCTK